MFHYLTRFEMSHTVQDFIADNILGEGTFMDFNGEETMIGSERLYVDTWSDRSQSLVEFLQEDDRASSELYQRTIGYNDEKNSVVGLDEMEEYVSVSSVEYVDTSTFDNIFTQDATFIPEKIFLPDNTFITDNAFVNGKTSTLETSSAKINIQTPPKTNVGSKTRSNIVKSHIDDIRRSGLRYSEAGIPVPVAKRTPQTKHSHDATELYYDPVISGLRNQTQEEINAFEHIVERKRKNRVISQKKRDDGQGEVAELKKINRTLHEENVRIKQVNSDLTATVSRLSKQSQNAV